MSSPAELPEPGIERADGGWPGAQPILNPRDRIVPKVCDGRGGEPVVAAVRCVGLYLRAVLVAAVLLMRRWW